MAGGRNSIGAEHRPVEPGTQHGSADAEVAVEGAGLTRVCYDINEIGHHHRTGRERIEKCFSLASPGVLTGALRLHIERGDVSADDCQPSSADGHHVEIPGDATLRAQQHDPTAVTGWQRGRHPPRPGRLPPR